MPRYEKIEKKHKYFIEIMLDGPYVRFARGVKKAGDNNWFITEETSPIIFQNQEKAKEYYKKRKQELERDGELVSRTTPEIKKRIKPK